MGGRAPGAGGLKVRIISVGKDRSGLFEPAVQEYASRLEHYARFELVELRAGRTKEAEAEAILSRVGRGDWLVALDQSGQALDSVQLAGFVQGAQAQAKDLSVAVGGDEGLAPEVLRRARLVLSLSKMTFPHRLARVMISEQLYRAFTILARQPYHK